MRICAMIDAIFVDIFKAKQKNSEYEYWLMIANNQFHFYKLFKSQGTWIYDRTESIGTFYPEINIEILMKMDNLRYWMIYERSILIFDINVDCEHYIQPQKRLRFKKHCDQYIACHCIIPWKFDNINHSFILLIETCYEIPERYQYYLFRWDTLTFTKCDAYNQIAQFPLHPDATVMKRLIFDDGLSPFVCLYQNKRYIYLEIMGGFRAIRFGMIVLGNESVMLDKYTDKQFVFLESIYRPHLSFVWFLFNLFYFITKTQTKKKHKIKKT